MIFFIGGSPACLLDDSGTIRLNVWPKDSLCAGTGKAAGNAPLRFEVT